MNYEKTALEQKLEEIRGRGRATGTLSPSELIWMLDVVVAADALLNALVPDVDPVDEMRALRSALEALAAS